jgi:glycosyltransferase involved in cell wall biosynthesis
MKILLGAPEYPPYHIGGGGEVYKNLAINYRKLGCDVVVIYGYYPTTSWWESIKEYQDENGIKFYQVPEIPSPNSMPYLRTAMPPNLNAIFKLRKIIMNEKPDIVHLHGYGIIFINILANITRALKIKYIFTIHGYPEKLNRMNFLTKFMWMLYIKLIMNKTLMLAEKITCVSDYVKNDNRNIHKDKSVTIHNGLNFEEYRNIGKIIDIRKKHNINKDTIIFLSVGRISEMKGFQEIIKLIPAFSRNGIKIKYLIIGQDDGYRERLEILSKQLNVDKYVKFIGFVDSEVKKQYIKECDIFAVPSLWEPFGLVALEGMISDKVILTTDMGGLKEVLDGYKKKIYLYDNNLIDNIKMNVRNETKSKIDFNKFDWSNISKNYLSLFG